MKYVFTQIKDDIASVKAMYPEMDDNKFYEILKLDPTYKEGINSVGTYGKWLLNLYKKGNLKEEDFYKVPDYLKKFELKKKAIKNKDIGTYKSLPELVKVIEETQEPEQSQNQLKKAISRTDIETDAEFIGDFDNYVCYSPKTYEASCKLGKGTHWCTATNTDRGYYDRYVDEGKLYIFINKSSGQAEYQFHFETKSFMDKNDSPISLADFAEKVPSSVKFIAFNIKRTLDQWNVWNLIEDLGKISLYLLDNIKKMIDNMSDKRYVILSVMKNKYLEPYFEKEIERNLKQYPIYTINYLFNDEKREKNKKFFIEYFHLENNTVEIKSKDLSHFLYQYGKTNLSRDFINGCCYEDLWEQFGYYDNVDTSYGEDALDKDNKKRMEDLHIEYKNIPDEYRFRALEAGYVNGATNDCLSDFNSAIKDMINGKNEGVELKNYIPEIKRVDSESFIIENFTIDDYFRLLDQFKNDVDLDDKYFDNEVSLFPNDVIPYLLAQNFEFNEPYYGWSDFDEDSFNMEIDEGLYAIETGNEEPEFDDDEELEEWRVFFKKNFKKEDIIAEGQQKFDFGDSKEAEIEDFGGYGYRQNYDLKNIIISEDKKQNIYKIDDKVSIFTEPHYVYLISSKPYKTYKGKNNGLTEYRYKTLGSVGVSGEGELYYFIMNNELRGQGYGSKLIEYGKKLGGFYAGVYIDNYPSIRAFEKNGFRIYLVKDNYKEGNAVQMIIPSKYSQFPFKNRLLEGQNENGMSLEELKKYNEEKYKDDWRFEKMPEKPKNQEPQKDSKCVFTKIK